MSIRRERGVDDSAGRWGPSTVLALAMLMALAGPAAAQPRGLPTPGPGRPGSNSSSSTKDLMIRGGLLAACAAVGAALFCLGVFPYMLRRGSWPLDAFGVAAAGTSTTFFIALLALFWDRITLPNTTGSFVDHVPRLLVFAAGLVFGMVLWNYGGAAARKGRLAARRGAV